MQCKKMLFLKLSHTCDNAMDDRERYVLSLIKLLYVVRLQQNVAVHAFVADKHKTIANKA